MTPLSDRQKRYLLSLWHWEFWWFNDATKEAHELIKAGKVSMNLASELIDLSITYNEQSRFIDDHQSLGDEELARARTQLENLKNQIIKVAHSICQENTSKTTME